MASFASALAAQGSSAGGVKYIDPADAAEANLALADIVLTSGTNTLDTEIGSDEWVGFHESTLYQGNKTATMVMGPAGAKHTLTKAIQANAVFRRLALKYPGMEIAFACAKNDDQVAYDGFFKGKWLP